MKYLILLLLCSPAYGINIDCYYKGHKEFHDSGANVIVTKQYIIVPHSRYDNIVIRNNKHSPNCIMTKAVH
jgi:hypothetical protein